MKIAKEIAEMVLIDIHWQGKKPVHPDDIKWLESRVEHLSKDITARLEPVKKALSDLTNKLDYQWYQTDPFPGESGSVKEGDHHPWVKEIEAALALFEDEPDAARQAD